MDFSTHANKNETVQLKAPVKLQDELNMLNLTAC